MWLIFALVASSINGLKNFETFASCGGRSKNRMSIFASAGLKVASFSKSNGIRETLTPLALRCQFLCF